MQHRIVIQRGYHKIRTATALPLKPMMMLNLQEGFDVIGIKTFHGVGWKTKALLFEKTLATGNTH